MMKYLILTLCLIAAISSFGQETKKSFESKDSLYNVNIKKSKLYGVYIPRDLDDALGKLMELTTEEARKPILKADENMIAKKLHFGLGRWMSYNWNFDEGSRFSHILRQKGLIYTDDMITFMLITFTRYVKKENLDTDTLIKNILIERQKLIDQRKSQQEIIKTETRPGEKKE